MDCAPHSTAASQVPTSSAAAGAWVVSVARCSRAAPAGSAAAGDGAACTAPQSWPPAAVATQQLAGSSRQAPGAPPRLLSTAYSLAPGAPGGQKVAPYSAVLTLALGSAACRLYTRASSWTRSRAVALSVLHATLCIDAWPADASEEPAPEANAQAAPPADSSEASVVPRKAANWSCASPPSTLRHLLTRRVRLHWKHARQLAALMPIAFRRSAMNAVGTRKPAPRGVAATQQAPGGPRAKARPARQQAVQSGRAAVAGAVRGRPHTQAA